MNKYPNAARGVQKIFNGEIVSLIGAVAGAILAVFTGFTLGATLMGNVVLAGVFGLISIILSIGVAVLSIIAFVLLLTGLKSAGQDNVTFNKAIIWILVDLGATILAALLSSLLPPVLITIINAFNALLDVIVIYFVVTGCVELLPGTEFEAKSRNLIMMCGIAVLVAALAKFLAGPLGMIASILDLVATVAYYVMYLSFLNKAKNAL